jgi:hypothetical protein
LPGEQQENKPEDYGHDPREGERGEDAHATTQLAHHRCLNGAREARSNR